MEPIIVGCRENYFGEYIFIYSFTNYWLLWCDVLTKISEDHTASFLTQKNKSRRTGRKTSLWNNDNCHQSTKRQVPKDSIIYSHQHEILFIDLFLCVSVHIYGLFSNAVSRMILNDLKFNACKVWKQSSVTYLGHYLYNFPEMLRIITNSLRIFSVQAKTVSWYVPNTS